MFTKQDISFLHQTKQKFLKELLEHIPKHLYDHFSSRIKNNASIKQKLTRKYQENEYLHTNYILDSQNNIKDALQYNVTPYFAVDYLCDIIGIRIVTQYVSNIYDIVNIIKQHYKIKEECDYIAQPKDSGYRSYHIVISIPVDIKKFPYADELMVEIQIRTLGMDFWASLEHSLVYDKQKNNNPKDDNLSLVHNELLNYAKDIFSIDLKIQALQHITEHHPGKD